MKPISYLLLLLFVCFSNTIFPQDQLYRSQLHKFRIKFPADWIVKDGDGPNVIKKAVKDGNSIFVLVKEVFTDATIAQLRNENPELQKLSNAEIKESLKEELDFDKYDEKEILNLAEDQVRELKAKFSDVSLLEKNIRFLDNKKFLYIKYGGSYRVQNLKVDGINISFIRFHNGKYYQVSGGGQSNSFDSIEPILIKSISTFVFEDYNYTNTETNQSETKDFNTVDYLYNRQYPNKQTPNIYLVFLAIFLISPSISIILRFLVKKDSCKKNNSIVFSLAMFLLVFFLWIYLTKEINLSISILILTVPISYYILVFDNKININSFSSESNSNNVNQQSMPDIGKSSSDSHKEEDYDITQYVEIEDSSLRDEEKDKVYSNLLGLKGKLTKKDITKIYRSLIEKYHPDKVSHLGDEFQKYAHKKTKDINKAYAYFRKKYQI